MLKSIINYLAEKSPFTAFEFKRWVIRLATLSLSKWTFLFLSVLQLSLAWFYLAPIQFGPMTIDSFDFDYAIMEDLANEGVLVRYIFFPPVFIATLFYTIRVLRVRFTHVLEYLEQRDKYGKRVYLCTTKYAPPGDVPHNVIALAQSIYDEKAEKRLMNSRTASTWSIDEPEYDLDGKVTNKTPAEMAYWNEKLEEVLDERKKELAKRAKKERERIAYQKKMAEEWEKRTSARDFDI